MTSRLLNSSQLKSRVCIHRMKGLGRFEGRLGDQSSSLDSVWSASLDGLG